MHFELRLIRFKNDIKHLKVINELKIKKLPLFFKERGTQKTDRKDIANKFIKYSTNIRQSITQRSQYKGSKKYSYYLNKNVTSAFTFQNVDEETVRKTINNLTRKPAVDLLKIIEPVIL